MGSTGATGSNSRSRGASSSPAPVSLSSIKVQNGNTVTLDKPLQYGQKDPNIPDAVRTVFEAWEQHREQSKYEHVMFTDDAGTVIYKKIGGKTGISINLTSTQEKQITTMSHNHPRSDDTIGGTLSNADLRFFVSHPNLRTMRATAAEGTYSISKGANFNKQGFIKDIVKQSKALERNLNRKVNASYVDYMKQKITWAEFKTKERELFNGFLVRTHNILLNNQSVYGYTYTLEQK